MRKKIIILGIDGMDKLQIYNYLDYLPTFKEIIEQSPDIELHSVFPPDTLPAWGTIYTGLNPAEHGVVTFSNIEEKLSYDEIRRRYMGKTFWDIASKNNKSVCILLPHSIETPWKVNGVMITRSMGIEKKYELRAYPEDVYYRFNLKEFKLELFHGFPSKRQLRKYKRMLEQRTKEETRLMMKFLKNYNSDLFFMYFSSLDAIQHTFWNYCDPTHPDYPGENKWKNTIRDFYIMFDRIVKKVIDNLDKNTTLLIISDHGHGKRPTNLVNINEILRREGYLRIKKTPNKLSQKEFLKRLLVKYANTVGVGSMIVKFANIFPILKKMVSNPSYIDYSKTVAYLSAISAMKSYSEGGIVINKEILKKEEYEKIRREIVTKLSQLRIPHTQKPLFKWILPREKLYNGKYIHMYPDILFELDNEYGVGWGINGPIFEKSVMSKLQPGSHKRYSAVFLVYNLDNKTYKLTKTKAELVDIAPTVLNLLDIPYSTKRFTGATIFTKISRGGTIK